MSKYSLIESLTGALLGQSAYQACAVGFLQVVFILPKIESGPQKFAVRQKELWGVCYLPQQAVLVFIRTLLLDLSESDLLPPTARSFRVRFASTSVVQKREHYSLPQGKAVLGFRLAL
ncbi:hypothetical protein NPIL_377191 [Nephila pilipes]|uniref:Uncharacterized protein n=1 Tax=Nephila pilipes TaxID=299642 RepID=A0A8X6MDP5_NEPPI|nr:hypothetical protein NPIL_377191 [Nephila pilipes]